MLPIKILDCTLRDGGYYTNWDFDKELVNTYINAFNELPVDYLEIGYRSNKMKGYLGEYFYCPVYLMEGLKKITSKKLVIILDEKDVIHENIDTLLRPCIGLIDMVRIAIDPKNFKRALVLAAAIKLLGFEVGFNVMYMSKWPEQKEFLSQIKEINGIADYFYMVDSYGGVYPNDVKNIYELVKSQTNVKIGFHGHNNLELALINTLTAIECGAEIVDATVTGMGRGAGNLKTELLLTALNAKEEMEMDFNALANVVGEFTKLQTVHEWGTNLPYMVSGANSLPQKEVMDWVSKRFYSFNSIVRALHNQKAGMEDNQRFPVFVPGKNIKKAVIIGGGPTAVNHATAIKLFVQNQNDICLIHSSARNAASYSMLDVHQYYCLAGNEGQRLTAAFNKFESFNGICILPPYPRKMGTFVPEKVMQATYELSAVNYTDVVKDSHTSLAIQTAIELGVNEIYVTGYDGYGESNVGTKEQELFIENEQLFADAKAFGLSIFSLTPTRYKNLSAGSIYEKLN
ncbi:MAG: aldolase catalytic domain-containing protein [Ferruginibacter sp.]